MRRGKALPAHGHAPRTAPLVCAVGVVLLAAGAGPVVAEEPVMVLDSSAGSMEGATTTAAGNAVGAFVGVHGAKEYGCDDTRPVRPVRPLDRTAPKASGDADVLVSDAEGVCGAGRPCTPAAGAEREGTGQRIGAVGLRVRGGARRQVECVVAAAGRGKGHDVSDAAAPARQLTPAPTLVANADTHAYRPQGRRVSGGGSAKSAAILTPGQYTDTLGPGETRWYAVDLDAATTADLAVTAVPRTGVEVAHGDGIELRLGAPGRYSPACGTDFAHFGQNEGAMVLSGAVSRVPSADGHGGCDTSGRYALSVHRTSDAGSDRERWPVELRYGTEAPLAAGTTPAPAATRFGEPPPPMAGTPRDVEGGSGFNDALRLSRGVWRDALPPGRTRFYKVRVGWGQRLVYAAEFADVPVRDADGPTAPSFVATAAYGPDRQTVDDASGVSQRRAYTGRPVSVGLGTVPVTWTNRWVAGSAAPGARTSGDYYVAVSLGPGAARIARGAVVKVVLRVDVAGTELAGPQYKAAALGGGSPSEEAGTDVAAAAPGGGRHGGGFMTAGDVVAAGAGGAVALAGVAGVAALSRRRRGHT
ncbi:hypothetical protein ACIP98_00045 [Streptomyces sp. NPDC088354]|uniref:hypothetical protein n=1 Tax=Streptomyces sp. NPDC088354 TaxID=3365856 RepID=UPI00382A1A5C